MTYRRQSSHFLLWLTLLLGCVHMSSATTFPGGQWLTAEPESQGMDREKLLEAVEVVRDASGEDGADQLIVVRNGFVVWEGERARDIQRVWSCTKSFLSTCFGLLWDEGKVTPDTLAADILPELAEHYPDMTLEHLATFTSGYTHVDKDPLRPAPPLHPVGAAFHYNRQSDLLAALLTLRAERPLSELFREKIAEPLGISSEDMQWESFGEIKGIPVYGGSGTPGASVLITPLAMARFGWLYANGGVWEGRPLLSRRYIEYATVPRTEPALAPHDPKAWYVNLPGNYGFNWWTNGLRPNGERHWPHAPVRTFAAQGNRNNNCFVLPEWNLVVVRLGQDKVIDMTLYDRMFRLLGESTDSVE